VSLPGEVTAELFRAIAEYTYDWETWVDAEGVTRWINDAVARITGFSVSECLALPDYPLALACESDRGVLARVLADARAGGSGNDVEFRVCTKAGEQRWVAISWQSVRSVRKVALGYRTSIRDIDERKQMEAELHRIRHKAEALAQARSELLANVSHELRSPAHCIAGFADLLLQGSLDETQRHYVEVIGDQCRSMQRQVEDLLSLTALEAGGVELAQETVDLVALAQSLIDVKKPSAEASGVELSANVQVEQPLIEADGLRLQQILRNLIDNALKFTEHGSIQLRITADEGGERPTFLCEVIDTGAGMDQAQVGVMLLPFRQGDGSSKKRHGGVGLGLAIVQRLVNAMGGELTVTSQRKVGTRVAVRLPLLRPRSETHERRRPTLSAPNAQGALHSGHALVVDDSPHACELLAGLLASCGFSSAQALSAEQARQLVSKQHFDVMFIDYQMPDCDGAETALALRRALANEELAKHVPIFIVTANVFAHEQLRDARAYVDGVLAKPLSRAALRAVLGQLPSGAAPNKGEHALLREQVVQDLESTRHKSGKSLLQHLLPQVANDLALAQDRAEQSLLACDREALRRAAHELSGHASLLGAVGASRASEQLELLMEQDVPPFARARALLEAFAHDWKSALQTLTTRANTPLDEPPRASGSQRDR
jgi:PAS domain S-box-containing protein